MRHDESHTTSHFPAPHPSHVALSTALLFLWPPSPLLKSVWAELWPRLLCCEDSKVGKGFVIRRWHRATRVGPFLHSSMAFIECLPSAPLAHVPEVQQQLSTWGWPR